jgi:hypothetical protein
LPQGKVRDESETAESIWDSAGILFAFFGPLVANSITCDQSVAAYFISDPGSAYWACLSPQCTFLARRILITSFHVCVRWITELVQENFFAH